MPDLISRCKNVCEGKTIKNLSVNENGKFWELQMTDGSWIGFEPIQAIGAVCMQWGVTMPNDPSSPTAADDGVRKSGSVQVSKNIQQTRRGGCSVQRMVRTR